VKYLSHLELVRAFVRAFKRAGVRLAYSRGYHPMPKLPLPLPCLWAPKACRKPWKSSVMTSCRIGLLRDRISEQLPSGLEIKVLEALDREAGSLKVKENHYQITFNG